MKKLLTVFMSGLLLIMVVGCGSGETSGEGSGSSDSQDTENISQNISFWVYEPESLDGRNMLTELIGEFEEISGNTVEIEFIPKDDFNTKLNGSIAVGENPDVSYLDQPLLPGFVEDGVLLNLEEFAVGENGIDKSEYYEGALGTATVNEELYGLPLNQTTVALYYNKDLIPNPPATFEEWKQISEEVYEPNKIAAFEGLGGGGWGAWLLPSIIHSAGGSMVNDNESAATFASSEAIDGVELVQDILEFSDMSVRESNNGFGNGIVATKISGPWEINGLKTNFPELNFGVALIPHAEGQSSFSNIGGENLVVYEDTEVPEGAWELIKFLSNDENSIKMADVTGNFPVRVAAAKDPRFAEDEYLSVFLKQMETAVPRPRLSEWLKINDEIIGATLDDIFYSGDDVKDSLESAQEQANSLIKQ
ncbi:extracellular solute-binding protein [Halolactibacillus sp. JCM 19043]|uniref:sugar ABC transporter substrate-binding protein n=1 Tax=Halolactibacillus sp. JCM 19043 TaxID=1460638 RepID=UPI000782105E|nr:extracellular solute-binding protein [Halolactibacillus sp. JCM 19043]